MLSVIAAVGICCAELNASSPQPANQNTTILLRLNKSSTVKRPKTPDMQVITCEYDGKMMTLNFVLSEGISTFIVMDNNKEGGVYTIDTSALEVDVRVEELSYPIHVQLETETDKIYEGTFEK